MVMIDNADQVKINDFILKIEQELRDLSEFLSDVNLRSKRNGFLAVGDTVEVWKKAQTPSEESFAVISRAKISVLKYRMEDFQLEDVELARNAPENFSVTNHDFNSDNYEIRKILAIQGYDRADNVEDDDEDSEDNSEIVEYVNEELANLYSP